MYVGLAPGQSLKQLWKAEGGKDQTINIKVKTSDVNFHVGTLYYVILQSADGRVDLRLTLNQRKVATYVQTGISYKEAF